MDEDQKQKVMIAVVAFNFTVMALMIAFAMMGTFASISPYSTLLTRAAVSLVVGAVIGAAAYFAAQMSQR